MKPLGWFAFLLFTVGVLALTVLRRKLRSEAMVEEADRELLREFDALGKDRG